MKTIFIPLLPNLVFLFAFSMQIQAQSNTITTNITASNAICNGDCNGSISITAMGGTGSYSFYWSTGDTALGHSQGTILPNLCAGSYQVTVTDSIGNTEEDSIVVYEPTPIEPTVVSNDASCPTSCDGNAAVSAIGGAGSYTYYWNTVPPSTNSTATGLCEGSYNYVVSDASNCDTTAIISINSESNLELSFKTSSVCDEDLMLKVLVSNGTSPLTYSWSNGEISSSVSNISMGNIYIVTVTDTKGCEKNETIFVEPQKCPIVIPNTFSPNNDGINDTWVIKNLGLYNKCTVTIYNRWGDKVYYSEGYENPWEGNNRSDAVPYGVYYYVITSEELETNYAGSVTILK